MLTCEHEFCMWTYVGELYTFQCTKCKLFCKVDNREFREKLRIDPKLAHREEAELLRIPLPLEAEPRRCVLIAIEDNIGVIEKVVGNFAVVAPYARVKE